jgi:diguanylate cyclase
MDRSVLKDLLEGDEWPLAFVLSDKFLTFLDLIPEAVVISQPDGSIIQINDQAAKLFSYSREAFLALKIEDLVPERFRKAHPEKREFYYAHPKPRFLDNRKYELSALAKGKKEFPMEAALFALQTDQGTVAVNLIRDVSDEKLRQKKIQEENDELSEIAGVDQLTQLANRREFEKIFQQNLAKARRHKQQLFLLFIDLDHFKPVNDEHGHQLGDKLLQDVAGRIKKAVREEDFVARIGGDEFVVLLYPVEVTESVERATQRILDSCKRPFVFGANTFNISASIGIASYPASGSEAKALLNNADQAMYEAKQKGGNAYQYFQTLK